MLFIPLRFLPNIPISVDNIVFYIYEFNWYYCIWNIYLKIYFGQCIKLQDSIKRNHWELTCVLQVSEFIFPSQFLRFSFILLVTWTMPLTIKKKFFLKTAALTPARVSGLPAGPANFGPVSPHNCVSQFLKMNLSVYIYILLVLVIWETLTNMVL